MRIYSPDRRVLMRKGRKRLRLVLTSGRSIHQIFREDFGGAVANPVIKWYSNIIIDFSASLVWCMFGGKSRS